MSVFRESARGQDCQIRIPGVCNGDPATTVLAHLNGNKSLSSKSPDIHGAFACHACHQVVDGDRPTDLDKDLLRLWHYDGVRRTQLIWIDMGLLPGGKQ